MCECWSGIVTRDGRVLWCEMDSHEAIIKRSGLKDDKLEDRDFVRLEVPRGNMERYRVDEVATLPRWYEKREESIRKKVAKILDKLNPLRPAWHTLNADQQSAWDKLIADQKTAWDKLNAEHKTAWDKLLGGIAGYVGRAV